MPLRMLVLLVGVSACGREGTVTAGGDIHAGEPVVHLRGSPRYSSTPEHRFLIHLLSHEASVAQMLRQAASSATTVARRVELERIRDQQEEDLATLRGALRAYADPEHRAGEAPGAIPRDSLRQGKVLSEKDLVARTAAVYREEIADIDAFLPRLTASEVGTLAQRMRSQRVADIERLVRLERPGGSR